MAKKRTTKRIKERRSNPLTRAKPVSEVVNFVTSLFYGRSGTGKTTLAATYPKKGLFLDFRDKGTDSIRDVEGIDILEMGVWDDVEDTYWALKKESKLYRSLVIDTVSGMQTLAIAKVKEDNNVGETENLSRRNWGEVAGLMTTWIMNYRDLPMHVVFLAADRIKNASDEDDEDSYGEERLEPEVGPSLIPSVARLINASVEVIGNTFIRQRRKAKGDKIVEVTSYMLRVGPHPYFITKIRSPKSYKTPGSISNPTFGKIQKIIRGEFNE